MIVNVLLIPTDPDLIRLGPCGSAPPLMYQSSAGPALGPWFPVGSGRHHLGKPRALVLGLGGKALPDGESWLCMRDSRAVRGWVSARVDAIIAGTHPPDSWDWPGRIVCTDVQGREVPRV